MTDRFFSRVARLSRRTVVVLRTLREVLAEATADIDDRHVDGLGAALGVALRRLEIEHAQVADDYGDDTPAGGRAIKPDGIDERPERSSSDAEVTRVRELAGRTAIALRVARETLDQLRFDDANAYVAMAKSTEKFHLEIVVDCSEDTPPGGVQIGNDRTPKGARKPWAR